MRALHVSIDYGIQTGERFVFGDAGCSSIHTHTRTDAHVCTLSLDFSEGEGWGAPRSVEPTAGY